MRRLRRRTLVDCKSALDVAMNAVKSQEPRTRPDETGSPLHP
jgi:hypothetical protein